MKTIKWIKQSYKQSGYDIHLRYIPLSELAPEVADKLKAVAPRIDTNSSTTNKLFIITIDDEIQNIRENIETGEKDKYIENLFLLRKVEQQKNIKILFLVSIKKRKQTKYVPLETIDEEEANDDNDEIQERGGRKSRRRRTKRTASRHRRKSRRHRRN